MKKRNYRCLVIAVLAILSLGRLGARAQGIPVSFSATSNGQMVSVTKMYLGWRDASFRLLPYISYQYAAVTLTKMHLDDPILSYPFLWNRLTPFEPVLTANPRYFNKLTIVSVYTNDNNSPDYGSGVLTEVEEVGRQPIVLSYSGHPSGDWFFGGISGSEVRTELTLFNRYRSSGSIPLPDGTPSHAGWLGHVERTKTLSDEYTDDMLRADTQAKLQTESLKPGGASTLVAVNGFSPDHVEYTASKGSFSVVWPAGSAVAASKGLFLVKSSFSSGAPTATVETWSGSGLVPIPSGSTVAITPSFVDISVDANRDGFIRFAGQDSSDQTSASQPHFVVVNDGFDSGTATPDFADNVVNGADDLKNFFPVALYLNHLLNLLPTTTVITVKLKQAEGAFNFVYTDLSLADGSNASGNLNTGFGPTFTQPAASATTERITSDGIELSAAFLARMKSQGQGVIFVEARAATTAPLVMEVSGPSGVLLSVPVYLNAVELGRAVDANRDGVITLASQNASDVTNPLSPFRFWVNDDDDDGDDKRSASDDISLPEGDSKRDSDNAKVDGIRDLEDFFPVYFDIKQLLAAIPPGTNGLAYYLKHEDSALGVVFTSYTRTQAFDYLRGSPSALDTGFGPALTQKAGDATVVKVTAAGVDISTAGQPTASPPFFDRIKNNNDGGVLLIEASKATTKPLVLEVRKGSTVIAEFKLDLKIDPVETMFHYVNLRSFAHGTPIASNKQGPGFGSMTPTAAPNAPFATAANGKNIVFVHGYNVNGEGARGSAATAFKRFYWSGSKAKFYAVIWRGDDGQGAGIAPAGATPDYHRNVGHAWQQGPLFRDFLGTLQGDTAIMAHSLGNLVTQVALTRTCDPNNNARLVPASRPATVKHYFAVDAAVPLEATSATDITSDSKSKLRHSWWAEYDNLERLWPSQWHALFAGTGDAREGLTWKNVFATLEVGTNFYSSGEEVLANPVDDGMPFWEPLFFAGLRAWVAQEKLKGGNGAGAPFLRSWTAGWVENMAWYVPIVPTPTSGSPQTRRRFASEAQDVAAPNGVPTSSLASKPFFQRFQASEDGVFYPGYQGSRLHAPVGDTNADDEARKLVTVAKCLGEAIPALSFPQGSNPASAFTRPGMGGNSDLNTSNFKNGWPASRGSDTNWKHSDCLDVSYIFQFKLYDRMKTDGGL